MRVRETGQRPCALRCMLALVLGVCAGSLPGATLPEGFQETVVFSGLTQPTAVAFASDGRVFVAEKSGLIKVFDNLSDRSPTIFADLRTKVHNYWDRGLLGLALHPAFPSTPYVYVLYTHDAAIGGVAPRWGTTGATSDGCPDPPGATRDGCVVSGRLSRLRAAGNVMTGSEQVLVEDWFQQYPSHSIGSLVFGSDGALYVSAGDGASFNFTDYGQDGNPRNPGGDPPVPVGGAQSPPAAEGGSLRSQDIRTSGDPLSLDGAILRLDPETGQGLPGNPFFGSPDANARRVIAYGLRNPFRIAARPGTREIWIGDVGWKTWEEINRVLDASDARAENFGWPCYEGAGRQGGFDSLDLDLCEALYAQSGAAAAPFYSYRHGQEVVAGEGGDTGNSSVSGLAFYGSGTYPKAYDDALFFADYSRGKIWTMMAGRDGVPDAAKRSTFVDGAESPADLKIGPGGDLFYVDVAGGTIRRIEYYKTNDPPVAIIRATPPSGPVPLAVAFDGTGSSDPNPGDVLTYAWDLDGDGAYDDSTAARPGYTFGTAGNHTVRLRVTDRHGESGTATTVVTAGNRPSAVISAPSASTRWKVGDTIPFSGSATDPEDGPLPASALFWRLVLQHCPSACHPHPVQDYPGVASGSFTAPDHEYPSHLELELTATDSNGLTHTELIRLDPLTVTMTLESSPSGLELAFGNGRARTPFSRTVIAGSKNNVSAPSPQILGSVTYRFVSWSDGGPQSHDLVAGTSATYRAAYANTSNSPPALDPVGDKTVDEEKLLSFTATASDPDVGETLSFSLLGAPPGAAIDPRTGIFRWTPTEAQGPGAYRFAVRVTDSGSPPLADDETITVTVNETVPPAAALAFYTVTACRVADTRTAAGPQGGPALAANAVRTFVFAGGCGVPPTAKAVSINVTVTQADAPGDLRLYPGGTPAPPTSTINYSAGRTRANSAVLALGASGDLSVLCAQPSGSVHLVLDVNGYFQ